MKLDRAKIDLYKRIIISSGIVNKYFALASSKKENIKLIEIAQKELLKSLEINSEESEQ